MSRVVETETVGETVTWVVARGTPEKSPTSQIEFPVSPTPGPEALADLALCSPSWPPAFTPTADVPTAPVWGWGSHPPLGRALQREGSVAPGIHHLLIEGEAEGGAGCIHTSCRSSSVVSKQKFELSCQQFHFILNLL